MSDRLLWLDFEATGLKYRTRDSVLEVAWTVTDMDLNQLTGIRQRFVRWLPPASGQRITALPNEPAWETSEFGPADVVREMHETSGLADEWTRAIYSAPGDVGQAIADDLARAHTGDDDKVYLAGAGVSHFDQDLLGLHVPEFARMDDGGRLHYRTFDVSVGAMTAGLRHSVEAASVIDLLAISRVRHRRDGITLMRGDCKAAVSGNLDLHSVRAHRAADDVAVALAYARALRIWIVA